MERTQHMKGRKRKKREQDVKDDVHRKQEQGFAPSNRLVRFAGVYLSPL